MNSPSSTSSSDPRFRAVGTSSPALPEAILDAAFVAWRQGRQALAERVSAWPLPWGAIGAVTLILSLHLFVVSIAPPILPARADLVERAELLLVPPSKPSIIFAGDSRVQTAIIPALVEAELGLGDQAVVNLGVSRGTVPSFRALYERMADRFAAEPIMVLALSITNVNEHTDGSLISEEFLVDQPLLNRFAYVPTVRALESVLAWERSLAIGTYCPGGMADDLVGIAEGGYRAFGADQRIADFSPERMQQHIRNYTYNWYREPVLDGPRWQRFERDLRALDAQGVQLVFLHLPFHPMFPGCQPGTEPCRAERTFRRRLSALAQALNCPVIEVSLGRAPGARPDELFRDLVHVNRPGAVRISRDTARRLRPWLDERGRRGQGSG